MTTVEAAVADALADQWDQTQIASDGTLLVPDAVALATNPILIATLQSAYDQGSNIGSATIGVAWNPKPVNAIEFARARAAELAGMRLLPNGNLIKNPNPKWSLADTTRDRLRDLVTKALETENPGTMRDLKAKIEQMPEFSSIFGEYRAEMVARSELAMANNSGNLDAMESGGIPLVYVLDNPTCKICGPVAGTTQTLEWARDNLIGHPHCVRAFNAVHPEREIGKDGGGAAGAGGGGIGVGTGLTGYRLEGQKKRCPLNCRDGKRPNGNACPHKSHTRKRDS